MEIGILSSIVAALKESGVSPAGVVFAIVNMILLYRSWLKEDKLSARQDAFYEQQQHFYAGVNEDLMRLQKEVQDCEQDRSKMALANMFLDRWKARCKDVCPNSDAVHKQSPGKYNGGVQ